MIGHRNNSETPFSQASSPENNCNCAVTNAQLRPIVIDKAAL
jgi:hypothetical protein